MMVETYLKDFRHKPFKPRPSDEQEVAKAKDMLQKVKEVRQMMKQPDSNVNLDIACKRCGEAAGKVSN